MDGESAFWSTKCLQFVSSLGIKAVKSTTTRGACCAERVIRSLKEIIFKYFHEKNTNKQYDVVDDVVSIYNNKWNRTINMSPKIQN